MVSSPTSPFRGGAGPSSSTSSHYHHDSDDVAPPSASSATHPYISGYSSFPSAGQSPPTTASTMRPSLSGLLRTTGGSSVTTGSVAPSVSSSSRAGGNAAPRPPSISFSHEDTDKSRLAYEELAASAKAYRVALGQLSVAASNFGAALEACARLKEARAQPYPPGPYASGGGGSSSMMDSGILGGDTSGNANANGRSYEASCTADVLLATSGLYYLMANQQGILAETVYRSFEVPVVHELDRYAADVEAEQEGYAARMREASREIRRLEKEGVKLRKPRQRDVGRMRSHLVAMTEALDGLTARQAEHAVALLDQSRDMSGAVSQASRNLVRAEVDILDTLARKGWPGGGLDMVLDGAVDLFSRDSDDYDYDDGNMNHHSNGYDHGAGVPSILGGLGTSSHPLISGAGGILGSGLDSLRLGPKPLLSGNSDDGHEDDEDDEDERTARIAVQDEDGDADDDYTINENGNDDDDDRSEVSTINGNARDRQYDGADADGSSTGILHQGVDRGRTPHKENRHEGGAAAVSSRPPSSAAAERNDNDGGDRIETASLKSARSVRADSLAMDGDDGDDDTTPTATPGIHEHPYQYQSLDSLAREAVAAVSSHARQRSGASTHSTSGGAALARRGRSRPFSPQRVPIDPHDDVFAERAGIAEGTRGGGDGGNDNDDDDAKGKAVESAVPAVPAVPATSKPGSRASSAAAASVRGTPSTDDDGVHV